ncbi:hypothetical protein [Vreelandella subglaciescola]|jgi:hypothetical protein|uniref:Uncharacterized protein n=1 Tax=Vreelandella subglaciescola TaxID=29571 RepID=A0A1M7EHH5_9GAMM|nr:hypothetical protein [Halomonas subglaciescola]SHL91224.1 hypothetical protein SAMN05878437_0226 [Halomonas subglaciescola]
MTLQKTRPRTQAELDADMAARPRPVRNTFEGMYPLHEDIELSDEQVQIVLDYLQEVDFHLPGGAAHEFLMVRWARYSGFQFLQEPLEAYAIGLRCTRPGMEDQHTFIRMSWGQLMGDPEATRLPVNEPVLASDMMTLARYRDTRTGPSRTGVDAYGAAPDGPAPNAVPDPVPGTDFDLKLLDGALNDVLEHHATGKDRDINSWWDPALNWGVALAGRYPRLKYFESQGRLDEKTLAALHAFEARAARAEAVLQELGLASPAKVAETALQQAEKAERGKFFRRHRVRNPQPLTGSRAAT